MTLIPIIRTFNLYHRKPVSSPLDVSKRAGYPFRELLKEDLALCSMTKTKGRYDKFIERFDCGHKCYGHDKDGKVISYFWVSSGQNAPFAFGVDAKILENQVYIWDCRISEDEQNQGLYRDGLKNIMALNADKTCLIVSEIKNIPSNKGIVRAGFEKYGQRRYCKFLTKVMACGPKFEILDANSSVIL